MTDELASDADAVDVRRAPAMALPFDADSLTAPLRTERMTLRPIEPDDSDDIWEYQRLPEVLRYIPWPPRSREEAHVHTLKRAGMRRLAENGDAFHFAMVLRGERSTAPVVGDRHRDRVVGDVMLRISSTQHAQLELGWVLHPAFQGRGLAVEATREAVRFAFEVIAPHRLEAHVDVRNVASAALCRRLGMRLEGALVEDVWYDGWQDSEIYGLLRREWEAERAPTPA
ncbi:GNAT family N-acetyltransferase [Agromyces sp. NPDC058064]|uniref:GNAT family N-acetyltransferase n=1 Tax=Agromyces sp. NPDC058064 TaxID=3346322 RepID=UPI0036DD6B26